MPANIESDAIPAYAKVYLGSPAGGVWTVRPVKRVALNGGYLYYVENDTTHEEKWAEDVHMIVINRRATR